MNRTLNSVGMPRYANKMHPTERFVAVRPDGRRSRVGFGSPLRAAEWAMNAFKVNTWTELHARGWTVQPVSWFRTLSS